MLAAARARLARVPNVRYLLGELRGDSRRATRRFDHVLLLQRPHVARASPARVLAEAARVLRAGGGLALVTLDAHQHADVDRAATATCTPGFKPAAVRRLLAQAGLAVDACEVTSRERRQPHFQIVTAFARKPARSAAR